MPSGSAPPNVDGVSADPPANVALATLRRARAQQEAADRWLRRLTPPLFVVGMGPGWRLARCGRGGGPLFAISYRGSASPCAAVTQEALTNITKHAGPERVPEMHLGYEPRYVRLTVENFAMNGDTAAGGRRWPWLRPDRDARAGRTAGRRSHRGNDATWSLRHSGGAAPCKPIFS